jgi:hypothetical protein
MALKFRRGPSNCSLTLEGGVQARIGKNYDGGSAAEHVLSSPAPYSRASHPSATDR